MNNQQLSRITSFFLLGGLVSNLGSLVFQICLALYALDQGWPLPLVGAVLGGARLLQVLTNLVVGDMGDRYNARQILLITEAVGALTDIAIILLTLLYQTWPREIFLVVLFARSLALGLQLPLRAKIGKVLASSDPHLNRSLAIKLNVVAQGTTLFGALFSLFLRRHVGFLGVCVFDASSFLLSAAAVLKLPRSAFNHHSDSTDPLASPAWYRKFLDYFRLDGFLFWQDLVLSFPVWGTQSLFIRLAGENKDRVPYGWLIYGLAVIAAGIVAQRWFQGSLPSAAHWLIQALAFVITSAVSHQFGWALLPLFAAYFIYFLNWHLLSAEYQVRAPATSYSGLASARSFTAITVISIGEFLVSGGASHWPITVDLSARAAFAFVVGGVLLLQKPRVTRPAEAT